MKKKFKVLVHLSLLVDDLLILTKFNRHNNTTDSGKEVWFSSIDDWRNLIDEFILCKVSRVIGNDTDFLEKTLESLKSHEFKALNYSNFHALHEATEAGTRKDILKRIKRGNGIIKTYLEGCKKLFPEEYEEVVISYKALTDEVDKN